MTARKILVPVDFSSGAEQALDYAIELAKIFSSHLTLLHVIDSLALSLSPAESILPPSVWQELEASTAESMEKCYQRVQDAGIQGETLITHGAPFDIIIHTAKAREVDLIVMGTHGRTGLAHALVGSVAEKVVRLSDCPVLVTR